MRISDWSSDVCSSDLFLLRRGNVVVEVPVHAAYLERGARVGGQQGHRPGMVQAQILDDGAGLDDGTAGVDQHREAPRSEEHTSELQSLMRISYAVFRLKKKNKTIITTY